MGCALCLGVACPRADGPLRAACGLGAPRLVTCGAPFGQLGAILQHPCFLNVSFPLRPSRLAIASVPFAALICLRSPPQRLDEVGRTTMRYRARCRPRDGPVGISQTIPGRYAAPTARRPACRRPTRQPALMCRPDARWASRFCLGARPAKTRRVLAGPRICGGRHASVLRSGFGTM